MTTDLEKLKIRRLNSKFENKREIGLREFLAMERTTLANERTLFSYIRTSLYLILGGIGFIKLEQFADLAWLGYTLFPVSAVIIIYGLVRYQILQKKLTDYYDSLRYQEHKNN